MQSSAAIGYPNDLICHRRLRRVLANIALQSQ
jgi:hypothetical protein